MSCPLPLPPTQAPFSPTDRPWSLEAVNETPVSLSPPPPLSLSLFPRGRCAGGRGLSTPGVPSCRQEWLPHMGPAIFSSLSAVSCPRVGAETFPQICEHLCIPKPASQSASQQVPDNEMTTARHLSPVIKISSGAAELLHFFL